MPQETAGARTFLAAAAVFVLGFVYRLPDATSLINDHFMHCLGAAAAVGTAAGARRRLAGHAAPDRSVCWR